MYSVGKTTKGGRALVIREAEERTPLASNPDGYRFWAKVGFQPYCTTMHLKNIRDYL